MTMYNESDFLSYVRSARQKLASVAVPGYEKYFGDMESFSPVMGFLEQVLYIIDFRTEEFLYISPNTKNVNGYEQNECLQMGPLKYMELMHEKDFSIIVNEVFPAGLKASKSITDYEMDKLKISFSYRLRQKDGSYRTLLNQFSHLLEDDEKNPLVIMGTTSNITDIHHKPELFARINYQTKKGRWEKIFERHISLQDDFKDYGITPKEMEIIRFVNEGLSSKEIANRTQRSEETIKSQRKSILSKTSCQSMTDVIVLATRQGWIN